MLAIRFFDVVLAVHIAGVLLAFGVTFAYPVLLGYVKRSHPASMGALHGAQEQISKKIIIPGMVVVLLAGIYLASDLDVWDRSWVTVPMVILLVLFGLGGAFFSPSERKLTELAQRDITRAGGPSVTFSDEYEALYRRVVMVGLVANVLVLIAIFFMVTKPGGY